MNPASSGASRNVLKSNVCTSTQLKSPDFQRWMDVIRHPPMIMHRKLWEWAYIAQALDERGMLAPGKRGLGFAVGREPLVAVFAARGCELLATDLDLGSAQSAGWTSTNQHAADLEALNAQGLCDADAFAQQVSFRVVDMNDVPEDLTGFDFVWSSCAIEHLGSIDACEAFLSRTMRCLKPGGVAVHTTEYNLFSNDATVDSGHTVIPRRRDLEGIVQRLSREGHEVAPLDLDTGDAEDDQVILHPPYEGYPCLKIWMGKYAATSVGIIATAGTGTSAPVSAAQPATSTGTSPSPLGALRNWLLPPAAAPAPASTGDAVRAASVDDIRMAYRLILGREADGEGLRHFGELAARTGAGPARVAELLMRSEEFKARHGGLAIPKAIAFDGYSLFVRTSDRDIGNFIATGGDYEPHVAAVVRRELGRGDTFLDVGANIGYFTMLAAHLVGAEGRVLALEPLDKNLQLIYASLDANRFSHVQVLPVGASDAPRVISMVTDPDTSNALVKRDATHAHGMTFASVRTLDWATAGLDRIDLMKIDIEGHELFAWRGARDMLARCRPRVVSEFHPLATRENSGADPIEYLHALFEYGRSVQVIGTADDSACASPEEVMARWERSDALHGGKGTSHVDLFVTPRQ